MGDQMPNALVLGPQKAGTTWVYEYLKSRGDVCLPRGVKETFFFDNHYRRGVRWYKGHFADCHGFRRVVEVAPTYFQSIAATRRIQSLLGAIPLVVTLREPVERTFSLYLHMRRYGMAQGSLAEAIDRQPQLLESSRYSVHLERWFASFGREKVLVVFQDDLREQREKFSAALCQHFSLPYVAPSEALARPVNEAALPPSGRIAALGWWGGSLLRSMGLYNVIEMAKKAGLKPLFFGRAGGRPLPTLTMEERRRLEGIFLPEVVRLESLLGTDLSRWTSKYGK